MYACESVGVNVCGCSLYADKDAQTRGNSERMHLLLFFFSCESVKVVEKE